MIKQKRVLAIPADAWACGYYRINEPFGKLATIKDGPIQYEVNDFTRVGNLPIMIFLQMMNNYDAVVFQRVALEPLVGVMAAIRKMGKKVYMDVDDDLFNVSTFSPAYSVWNKKTNDGKAITVFKEALKHIDCLFVSTPELIGTYQHLTNRIEVFNNAIDTDNPKYCQTNSRRAETPLDKKVVMWSGSSTHYDSLNEIAHSLRTTFDNRPDSLFALCSNKEFLDMFNISNEQKKFFEPVSINDYYNVPSLADIGLAPVKRNRFNDGKSELKCLEYGIWGVPTICSDAAPYVRFNQVSGGANLICRDNKPKLWNRNIAALLDNDSLRKELGDKSRKAVLEHYSLRKVNEKRNAFFEKELKII